MVAIWKLKSRHVLIEQLQTVHSANSNGSSYYEGKMSSFTEESEDFVRVNAAESGHEASQFFLLVYLYSNFLLSRLCKFSAPAAVCSDQSNEFSTEDTQFRQFAVYTG